MSAPTTTLRAEGAGSGSFHELVAEAAAASVDG